MPGKFFLLRSTRPWVDNNIAALGEPYTIWVYDVEESKRWYYAERSGEDTEVYLNIGGPHGSPSATLPTDYSMGIVARDIHNRHELLGDIQVAFADGPTVITSAEGPVASTGTAHLNFEATHPNWRFGTWVKEWLYQEGTPSLFLTFYMESGTSVQGEIVNAETGVPVPDAAAVIFYRNGPNIPLVSNQDGTFNSVFVLNHEPYLLDIRADGFIPYRTLLMPENAVVNPEDPRTRVFNLTGGNAVQLVPLERPLIAPESLAMNRPGGFLPGISRAGNQSVFEAFSAEGPLTMTWNLDVTPGQDEYTVVMPQFDGDQTVSFEDKLSEVWLVDMRSFPEGV